MSRRCRLPGGGGAARVREAQYGTRPLTLGPQVPRSGRLAAGCEADVITLDADPLADIGVLADPARITAVWTRGRQVKGTAA